jgi:hypothetical protein
MDVLGIIFAILSSTIGLIIFGFVVMCVGFTNEPPYAAVIGIIIIIIGIIRHIVRNKKMRAAIDAFTPLYIEIVDALKNKGYEVDEFENKKDRIRSNVLLNGNRLGEIFLVAPGARYTQLKRIEDMTEKDFKYNYSKKFKKSPGISSSYWPDNSLIGAFINDTADNCSEKGEWLSNLANIFKEKMSDK